MTNDLTFHNVSFSYGEHNVLTNITVEIPKGDFLAILGHNGAGKSTFMKIALGLLKPQSGSVEIISQNINFVKNWHKIGYVQQTMEDFDFQFPATVMEVVLMGRLPRKKGLMKSFDDEDKRKAIEALEIIGIKNIKNRKIGSLSGGQRQKVFLAKTLASEAEVLFLDEPTTAMDHNSQHAFYDLLQKINQERKITIILITHDIGQILQHVKRVLVINKKIVFEGKPGEFSKEKLLEMLESV